MQRQFYLFPSHLGTFYFFSLSDFCGRTSNTILNSLGESGPSCLVPGLAERVSVFHCYVLYWLWICHKRYYAEICSLYIHFGESFFFIMWNGVYDVEFYQMLFLHPLRCCDFCLFFCKYGVSHWLICLCWTILVTLDDSNLIVVYHPFYILLDSVW